MLLLLYLPVWAGPRTFTGEFVNTDIASALRAFGKEMGWHVYVAPGVEGPISVRLWGVSAHSGLTLLLHGRGYAYRFVADGVGGTTLVVAAAEKLDSIPDDIFQAIVERVPNPVCQEILLEPGTPRAKLMEYLRASYPQIEFTWHPTMNGFNVQGPVNDVRRLKAEVPFWDPPEPPSPPVTRRLRISTRRS